jgi:hypothetical protein
MAAGSGKYFSTVQKYFLDAKTETPRFAEAQVSFDQVGLKGNSK